MNILRKYIRKLIIESIDKKPKALFMAGMPGAGKSTVVNNLGLDSLFTTANLDVHYEAGLKREGIPLDIRSWMKEYSAMKKLKKEPGHIFNTQESLRFEELKRWASKITNLMFREAQPMFDQDLEDITSGMKNVLIDGTAANKKKIMSQMQRYEEMGYDVGMIMINITTEFAIQRNISRGETGGRSLPSHIIYRTGETLQVAKNIYSVNIDPYWEIDNTGTYEEYLDKVSDLRVEILDWIHS